MRRRVRTAIFFLVAPIAAWLLVDGLLALPPFGSEVPELGRRLLERILADVHVTNIVTGVLFDVCALDTMGEEMVLFGAVLGVALLLREAREGEREPVPEGSLVRSDLLRPATVPAVALLVVLGVYVVTNAPRSPGGGFQGGIVLSAAFLMVFLTAGYGTFRELADKRRIERWEGIALVAYVLMGAAPMLRGAPFLTNVLPKGTVDSAVAGGMVPVLNGLVAAAVACGFALLLAEFLEEVAGEEVGRPEEEGG